MNETSKRVTKLLKLDQLNKPKPPRNYYEVLWFDEARDNYQTRTFGGKKAAIEWYKKHSNELDKFDMEITYRDEDGFVINDIEVREPKKIEEYDDDEEEIIID